MQLLYLQAAEAFSDGRGGAYNSKMTMEHENAICDYIEKNPCTTLGELVDKLTDQHQLTVAKGTVFRQLDAITYSLK